MSHLPELYARYGALWGAWLGTLVLALLLYIGFTSVLGLFRRRATRAWHRGGTPTPRWCWPWWREATG